MLSIAISSNINHQLLHVREDAEGGDIIDSHSFCKELLEKENT